MARELARPKHGGVSDVPRRPSSKTPSIVRAAERLGRLIPAAELRRIPKDLSDQIDHYLYGAPKR